MKDRSLKENLLDVANKQHGYFTTKQAKEAGYKDSNFSKYVNTNFWKKVERGIYRLSDYPDYERPELIIWFLWSQNQSEPGFGVWSHETALEIYDLSDVNPTKLHMTVPKHFRKKGNPPYMQLHFKPISKMEIRAKDGFFITNPLRTLIDVFEQGNIERKLLRQCVKEAILKGIITKTELLRTKDIYPIINQILEVLNE